MKDARYGWVVVWATFVCLALIFGVSYSFAAFFESFAGEFAAQRADVSWIFGLSGLVYFVLGTLGGILADRLGRAQTLVLMQLSMGLSYLLWAVAGGPVLLVLFALWFGLSYGSIVSLLPAICMDYFGGWSVASVVGALYSGAAVGNLLGPVLAGAAFDRVGHYHGVMAVCLLLGLVATWASRRMQQTGRALY